MFSRDRRPTRCWVRIQIPPSGEGGLTSMISTASGERGVAISPWRTISSAFGKSAMRSLGMRRVPRFSVWASDCVIATILFDLIGAGAPHHGWKRLPEQLQVQPDAPVTHIVHVHLDALLIRDIRTSTNLPKPGNARFNRQQINTPLVILGHLIRRDHARTDQ